VPAYDACLLLTCFTVHARCRWDTEARYKIRIVCARPYHALFMNNMLIRPTEAELASFG